MTIKLKNFAHYLQLADDMQEAGFSETAKDIRDLVALTKRIEADRAILVQSTHSAQAQHMLETMESTCCPRTGYCPSFEALEEPIYMELCKIAGVNPGVSGSKS